MTTYKIGTIAILLSLLCLYSCSSPSFERTGEYVDGIAVALRPYKWEYSYIDTEGEPINPRALFKEANDFINGYAIVQFKDGSYGFVDKKIKVKTKHKYRALSPFSEGFAVFMDDNYRYGLLDEKFVEVLPATYENISDFSDGYAKVYDGRYGYINTKFEKVIECQYSLAGDFQDGLALVKKDGVCGIIDTKGKFTPMDDDYDEIGKFVEGMARVGKKNQWNKMQYGFVNQKGQLVIPCRFDDALDFSEGVAAVHSGYWYYYDKNCENVFLKGFSKATSFKNGKASVTENGVDYELHRDGKRGATTSLSLIGQWEYRDPADYGVYSIKINSHEFEFWYPDRLITRGTYTVNGSRVTLSGKNGNTYTLNVDMDGPVLVMGNKRFHKY